jgi:hypothetical protein
MGQRTVFMTEAEWATCTHPKAMLIFLADRQQATERQYRLFACACFRRVWHLLADPRARKAVEVAERYADAVADDAEREAALAEVAQARGFYTNAARWSLVTVARTAAMLAVDVTGQLAACPPGKEYEPALWAAETPKQCDVLRDIFGPLPFRSTVMAPLWRTVEVLDIARAIYEERAFDRMEALARALDRAGCVDREMLNHCLWSGEHARGCWVVDRLLEKERHCAQQ